MQSNTVAQFAAELKVAPALLLEQLRAAGVDKHGENDGLTEADKARLLDSLRKAHGGATLEKKKITLTRKQTSEIKQADGTGRARTIQVEVRKKRTFVKRGAAEAELEAAPAPAAPVVDAGELRKREEEARRQAELAARQAAEAKERAERAQREILEAQRREQETADEAQAREQAEQAALEKVRAEHAAAEAAAHEAQAQQERARRAVERMLAVGRAGKVN